MKSLKSILKIVLTGCLILAAAGCNELGKNNITAPTSPNRNGQSSRAAQFMVRKQMAALKSTGVKIETVDAFFGLGWTPYYTGDDESRKIFSDAFAVAINNAALNDTTQVFSFDMGTVTVHYDGESTELLKTEDEFGIFYDLFGPLSDDYFEDSTYVWEPQLQIPFRPGVVYRYETSGSAQVPPINLELNAPGELVQLTEPADGDTYNRGGDLQLTWQGGVAGDSLLISVFPQFSFEEYCSDHPEMGNPDEDFEDFWEDSFVMVDAGAGEYTFSADEMDRILGQESTEGIFVEIFAFKETVVESNGKTYLGEIHIGDMIELNVQ